MTTVSKTPIQADPGESMFHLWGRNMSPDPLKDVYYASAPSMAEAIVAVEAKHGITVNFATGLVDHEPFDSVKEWMAHHRGGAPIAAPIRGEMGVDE